MERLPPREVGECHVHTHVHTHTCSRMHVYDARPHAVTCSYAHGHSQACILISVHARMTPFFSHILTWTRSFSHTYALRGAARALPVGPMVRSAPRALRASPTRASRTPPTAPLPGLSGRDPRHGPLTLADTKGCGDRLSDSQRTPVPSPLPGLEMPPYPAGRPSLQREWLVRRPCRGA